MQIFNLDLPHGDTTHKIPLGNNGGRDNDPDIAGRIHRVHTVHVSSFVNLIRLSEIIDVGQN